MYCFRYKDLKEYSSSPDHVSAILVGTVVNSRTREIPTERASTLAEHIGIPYVEVNLDTCENVNESFEKLAELVIETLKRYPNALSSRQNSTNISTKPKPKQNMCAC